MAEPWAPSLADVAKHVPSRTRSADPGAGDGELGTFTPDTTPTDAQAADTIDDAVNGVLAQIGPLPTTPPATAQLIQGAARDAAAWQAAADIELAYPQRPGDTTIYDQLYQRAQDAMGALLVALEQTGTGDIAAVPQWAFPDPVPWGDTYV